MKDLAIAHDLPVEYKNILTRIDKHLAAATQDSEAFNKSSSQFKTATLDVVDLTPINSARHLLAVIQRTRQALEEASISLRRKHVDLSRKEHSDDPADAIDCDELRMQIANTEASARGATRKLAHAIGQYEGILNRLGVEFLTEEDYENDQPRYHIMTAFNQALTAARARGGLIDEGNYIY